MTIQLNQGQQGTKNIVQTYHEEHRRESAFWTVSSPAEQRWRRRRSTEQGTPSSRPSRSQRYSGEEIFIEIANSLERRFFRNWKFSGEKIFLRDTYCGGEINNQLGRKHFKQAKFLWKTISQFYLKIGIKFGLFIKLCHWVPKVPFFSKNGQKVKVERFHFYLKNRKIKR